MQSHSAGRESALDGLRGLAALIVVFSHVALLASVSFAATYAGHPAPFGSATWILADTPVFLVVAGPQCVTIFFVLSGYVLVAPLLRSGTSAAGWPAYYSRRLVRLYLPLLAATALAVGWFYAVRRTDVPGASWLLTRQQEPLTLRGLVKDSSAVGGVTNLNGPEWSLQWEVIFSLALPAYLAFSLFARRARVLKLSVCLLLVGVGTYLGRDSLMYLPVFGLGGALASQRPSATAWLTRMTAGGRRAATAVAVLLLAAGQYIVQGGLPAHARAAASATAMVSAGSAFMLVALALTPSPVRSVCASRAPVWLGAISFSLYLIHAPLITSLAFLLGGHPSVGLLFVTGVPAALAFAAAFHRWVEAPSISASRSVGRWVTGKNVNHRVERDIPAQRSKARSRDLADVGRG